MRSQYLLLLGAAACTGRDLGTLTESQAASVYTSVRSKLRDAHSLVLTSSPLPLTYSFSCPSGTIEIRLSLDAMMHPVSLRHALEGCAMNDLVIDGDVNYVNLDYCGEDGSGNFAFSFGGLVEVDGAMSGFCYVETRDDCGILDGHICGFPAHEIVIQP